MKKRKGGKKDSGINIHFSNRWLYTFIAILIIAAIGVGIYAYGTSNPSVFGHSSGELAPPAGCTNGQFLQWNGNAWVCSDSPPGNYFRNYERINFSRPTPPTWIALNCSGSKKPVSLSLVCPGSTVLGTEPFYGTPNGGTFWCSPSAINLRAVLICADVS